MRSDDALQISGRVKLTLAACFCGLLAILIALGVYAADTLNRAHTADTESTRLYLLHREALSSLRGAIYITNSSLRDYLLDPDATRNPAHASSSREQWALAQDALRRYVNVADPSPSRRKLEDQMAVFWKTAEQGLALTGRENVPVKYRWLADEISPARDRLLEAVETLVQNDNTMMKAKVSKTAELLDGLKNRLWLAVILSLLVSAALAAVTYRYLSTLEGHAAARYRQSKEAAAQLEQLSRRLLDVQENERKTLARELHDEVGQSLGAMLVDLGQVKGTVLQPEATAHIQSAVELGERTLRSIRDISLLLRPSMLDDLGLIPALHWQAREINRRTGMAVAVKSDEDELDLGEDLRTTIYRVVQEALNNAARHSGAQSAEVGITRSDGYWHILVRDDGKGFDPAKTTGLGLLGMQERVASLQGKLWIASAPGRGTTLSAELPAEPVKAMLAEVAG